MSNDGPVQVNLVTFLYLISIFQVFFLLLVELVKLDLFVQKFFFTFLELKHVDSTVIERRAIEWIGFSCFFIRSFAAITEVFTSVHLQSLLHSHASNHSLEKSATRSFFSRQVIWFSFVVVRNCQCWKLLMPKGLLTKSTVILADFRFIESLPRWVYLCWLKVWGLRAAQIADLDLLYRWVELWLSSIMGSQIDACIANTFGWCEWLLLWEFSFIINGSFVHDQNLILNLN